MVDPAPTAQENTNLDSDPKEAMANLQAMYIKQQNENIQYMRDNGNESAAKSAEIIRDIEDKAIYQDVDTGAEVTILDGDSKSIMPYLEASHQNMLENSGGVENIIDKMSEQMQAQVADGKMTQAAMDKQIEILREAGNDSAKFADLRFKNNDFFAEQAKIAGSDPTAVNDITLIANKTITMITGDINDPSKSTEVVSSSDLTPENLNMDTLIKIADGNELTASGAMSMINEAYGVDLNFAGILKDSFDTMLEKEGSLDAMVDRLEKNAGELLGDDDISPEQKNIIIAAVKESNGDSSVFAASMMNAMNDEYSKSQLGTDNSLNQEKEHQERQALNLQNLLGGDGENSGIKSLFSADNPIMQMFVGLIAALTGQNPDELMAKMQEKMDKKPADAKADDPKNEVAAKKDDTPPKADDSNPKVDDQKVAQNDTPQESKQEADTPEEDKGYVQGVGGGPVTFDVATLSSGAPIANFDVGSMIFGDGNAAPSVFNGLSNPDVSQISMVDPMVNMSATVDTVDPPKTENVIGSLNAI